MARGWREGRTSAAKALGTDPNRGHSLKIGVAFPRGGEVFRSHRTCLRNGGAARAGAGGGAGDEDERGGHRDAGDQPGVVVPTGGSPKGSLAGLRAVFRILLHILPTKKKWQPLPPKLKRTCAVGGHDFSAPGGALLFRQCAVMCFHTSPHASHVLVL